MKQKIIGKLWALWAFISFLTTLLMIYIPAMITWLIPDPRGLAYFIAISRGWMKIWLQLVQCPQRVVGKENFLPGNAYIVTCNHNSIMDPPLSCPFVPGPNKTIAKFEFLRIPLFNFFYWRAAIPVKRKSEVSRKRSYEKMKGVLAKGMHMCIYPEGTRNRTSQPLKAFHDGAFRLAIDTGHKIIPAVLLHTKKVVPVGEGFYFRPHPLEIHFLEPVSGEGHTVDTLREKVFQIMEAFYVRHAG